MRYDKILFVTVALILYYTVLYSPFFLLKFSIYNDQLGFALETLYGYVTGYVVPYQGEYATLGHAYFTTVLGKILDLDLYSVVKYEEAIFVFIPFLMYLSFAIKFIKKHVTDEIANLLGVAALLAFPSFALEPLVYSRGYFGLILGIVLFACSFVFIENRKISDLIISTIVFVSSSISYPLQSLILVFSMAILIFISWFLGLIKKIMAYSKLSSIVLKVLYFFVIWTIIQVFYGYGFWDIFREIIFNILQGEYFTAFETSVSIKYVGDASVYVNLRIIMMALAWIISTFIALILLLKILRLKVSSYIEQFVLSIIATILLLGVIYGVAFHEPTMRFYRTLVAVIPFALLNIGTSSTGTGITNFHTNKSALRKILMASLLLTLSTFLLLSPIIKWGWMFIGYPTTRDIALADYIISYYMPSYYCNDIYPPGSHGLLKFYFESNKLLNKNIGPVLFGIVDTQFDSIRASSSSYTATFYRIFLFPRWQGEDVNKELNEILIFSSQNNILYSDFPWLTIGRC
ncbi:MAG: hypothetical protein QXX41_05520 [Nitrososphaerota archaeon]